MDFAEFWGEGIERAKDDRATGGEEKREVHNLNWDRRFLDYAERPYLHSDLKESTEEIFCFPGVYSGLLTGIIIESLLPGRIRHSRQFVPLAMLYNFGSTILTVQPTL